MVLPLIIAGGLVVVVLMFRDQIKNFADDLRDKSNDPENIEKQKKIDERGALENTQAFFLGEKGLEDLKQRGIDQEANVNQFIKDSQTKLDLAISGVNTSLVQSQQNLEKFAQKSQEGIAKSINETQQNIDTSIKATQTAIDTSIKETQTSIDSTFKGAQDFFGNIFNNPFGGQSAPKTVITETPKSTTPPPVTSSPKNSFIDLSFLTPNTSFNKEDPQVAQEVEQTKNIRTRFGV